MRINNKKFIVLLLICFFALGGLSFMNHSFYSTELDFEKNTPYLKTADTNLKIAVLNSVASPIYAIGGDNNDYLTIYNGLIANGFDTIVVTNADILADILLTVDVLVLIDNWPSDAASVTIRDWALKGGGILSFDSSICLLNWAGLIPPEADGSNGGSTYWEYMSAGQGKVVNDEHPVMNDYSYGDIVNGSSGDSRYYSDVMMTTSAGPYYTPLVKEDLGSNYDLVVALDAPYCGRVVHIWDQIHWNTTTNRQMILNSINWIREKFIDVPQNIVINEVFTGDPVDYIELYNFGSSINMSGWYVDFYHQNSFFLKYTFPDGWMFNSHQVVTIHEISGTDTSTDLYIGSNLPWTTGPVAVGLFDDMGGNVDWFQTFDHTLSIPVDAQWINDTIIDTSNNYAYRIRDLDTNRASDWKVSGIGSAGVLHPGQRGYFFDFPTITGPVAIFQDDYPWNFNSTDVILDLYGISYTIYDSSDFGVIDLSSYQKVIISSAQAQTFYNRLGGNVSWFESYASSGGILEIHACDNTPIGGVWDGLYLMPGGLDQTPQYLDAVDISLTQHPIVLNPHTANDTNVDNWLYSAHGYFTTYPSNSREILQYTITSDPILLEFEYGNGFIIATMQGLEHAYYNNDPGSKILENIILHDSSSTYFSDTLTVETPDSISSWQTGSSHYIEWTTTGNISNVKIELYRGGVFEMEITANITNDGEHYWTFPLSLTDSTQYQIKVTDVNNPLTYDYSEYFELYNPTITITSPDSSSSWIRGTEHFLNWTSTGTLADVKIELFLNDTFVLEIAANTPNDGEYTWNIPSNLTTSTLYQIKISDATNPLVYDYSDNFEIRTPSAPPGGTTIIIVVIVIIGGVAVAVTVFVILKKRKPK